MISKETDTINQQSWVSQGKSFGIGWNAWVFIPGILNSFSADSKHKPKVFAGQQNIIDHNLGHREEKHPMGNRKETWVGKLSNEASLTLHSESFILPPVSVFSSYQTWVLLWFSFDVGWAEHATESKNKDLTKSQQSLPGSGKRSVGQDCLMSRVSFRGDENALEVDGGYGWKHYEYATYRWILHFKVWKWGILCYVSFTIRKKNQGLKCIALGRMIWRGLGGDGLMAVGGRWRGN